MSLRRRNPLVTCWYERINSRHGGRARVGTIVYRLADATADHDEPISCDDADEAQVGPLDRLYRLRLLRA
jgi:hypothetical protein